MKAWKRHRWVCSVLFLPLIIGGLDAQRSGTPRKGDPVKGKKVYAENACQRCHDIETGISKRPPAPSLKNLYQAPPHALADGTKHDTHTDEMFRTIIREGTSAMNPRGAVLTDEELDDLIAYLHTL